jgi:hypothetical protein
VDDLRVRAAGRAKALPQDTDADIATGGCFFDFVALFSWEWFSMPAQLFLLLFLYTN